MAGRKDSFTLTVVGEAGVVYYGDCRVLFVPTQKEQLAIMPEHTPMIAQLGSGDVIAQEGSKKHILATIKTGLLYVGDGEVSVLVDV